MQRRGWELTRTDGRDDARITRGDSSKATEDGLFTEYQGFLVREEALRLSFTGESPGGGEPTSAGYLLTGLDSKAYGGARAWPDRCGPLEDRS